MSVGLYFVVLVYEKLPHFVSKYELTVYIEKLEEGA